MKKILAYRTRLRELDDWEPFLLAESGLPGPRANLELAQAVAEEGDEALFDRYLAIGADQAPANSPLEFLPVCGVLGMGRLLAEGRDDLLPALRRCASDPRWRTREAVAMALQRLGDGNMDALLQAVTPWAQGNLLEQRAAVAALCEPRLLGNPAQVRQVLSLLDRVTAGLVPLANRRSDEFRVLRQGLGYCWSVAVVALPGEGKAAMEKWLASNDPDVRWIMRENLKKDRLARMDREWTERWRAIG
jgi:HEAT repeat protein